MKYFYGFLFTFLFILNLQSQVYAQNPDINKNFLVKSIERTSTLTFTSNDTYTYTYNEDNKILSSESEKYRYYKSYDKDGNLIEYKSFIKLSTDDVWWNDSLISYTFDDDGRCITKILQEGEETEWINSSKWTYTYDEKGNKNSVFREWWNNDKWNNSYKVTYTYFDKGLVSNEVTINWDREEKRWKNGYKRKYTYNQSGLLLSEVRQYWRNEDWENSSKYSSEYDDEDKKISSKSFSWEENKWVVKQTTNYYYDENGYLQKSEYKDEYYDYKKIYTKTTYSYDDKYNLLEEKEVFKEDENSEIWHNSLRRIYNYDEGSNLIEFICQRGDRDNDYSWEDISRRGYTYDNEGNLIELYARELGGSIYSTYLVGFHDAYGNTFSFEYGGFFPYINLKITWKKITTDIGEHSTENSFNISLLPNPFSSSTNLKYTLEEPAPVKIQVFDNLGRDILSVHKGLLPLGEHSERINLENFPPGMYFYTIQIGEKVESGKLMRVN